MCSGGNIDTPVYIRALERALAIDGRLWLITVTISDIGSGLAELTKQINGLGIKLVCTISALCNLWINSFVLYNVQEAFHTGQQTFDHQTVSWRQTMESIDRIPFGLTDLQSMDSSDNYQFVYSPDIDIKKRITIYIYILKNFV